MSSTPTRRRCSSRVTSAPSIPVSPVQEASFDLPFTVGLFPLFLQNGIWANDAILGGAVSLPAKNSAAAGPCQLRHHLLRRVRQCRQRGHHRSETRQQRQPLWRHHLHRRLRRLYRSGLRPDPGPRRTGRPSDALPDRRLQPALFQHLVELDPRVRELRQRREGRATALPSFRRTA